MLIGPHTGCHLQQDDEVTPLALPLARPRLLTLASPRGLPPRIFEVPRRSLNWSLADRAKP
jgi:hypothetical protein